MQMVCSRITTNSVQKNSPGKRRGPFPIEPMPSSTQKNSGGKRRGPIPLEPMSLTALGFSNSPKKRKTEAPIRKELFKLPQKKTENRFSRTRQSLTRGTSNTKRTPRYSKVRPVFCCTKKNCVFRVK